MRTSINSSLPQELCCFDQLPNSAYVAQPIVERLYDFSGPTLWRRVKDGTVPAPRKLSPGCTRWNVGELRAALHKA